MTENILIAIAWPYANAEIHVGNITGSHLSGDIIARYHRLKGKNVAILGLGREGRAARKALSSAFPELELISFSSTVFNPPGIMKIPPV